MQDAFTNGAREKLIYVPCIIPDYSRPDYLATVDVDPESASYGKVCRGWSTFWAHVRVTHHQALALTLLLGRPLCVVHR